MVIDVQEKDNSNLLIVKKGLYKVYVYDKSKQLIKPGYVIKANGKTMDMDKAHVINGFDYQNYLVKNKVLGIIGVDNVQIVEKKVHINLIKHYIYKYVDMMFNDEVKMIVKGFILGNDSDFTPEFSKAIEKNAIMHLFAVSGLHVNILVNALANILKKAKVKEKISIFGISTILFIYMLITSFSPSIVRAGLIYYLKVINDKYKLELLSLDRLSIIYIILLISNPFHIYNLGFVLSFIMAFFIILYSPIISKNSNIVQGLKISLIAILVTFPIIINVNPTLNIISPLINVIFIEIVSIIILPLTFIVFVLPFFASIYQIIIKGFVELVILTSKINIPITFSALPFILVVIFYIGLIYLSLKQNRKSIILFSLIMIIIYCYPVTLKNQIHFLDLENGESIVINDYNGAIVIDTGDGTNNEVTSFIKKQGIKTIEYLILTHNHNDHNGEAQNIIGEINVNKIIISEYDNSDISKNYLQYSKNKNIELIRVKKGDKITSGKITFNILSPEKQATDENDESLVMTAKIGEMKYLFLGDATKKIENDILEEIKKIDIIKIAHHGSSTSTSKELIDKLNPKYAIIQAGRIEKFGFPHQETIDTLAKYKVVIYRTDKHYSILIKYNKKNSIIKTLK